MWPYQTQDICFWHCEHSTHNCVCIWNSATTSSMVCTKTQSCPWPLTSPETLWLHLPPAYCCCCCYGVFPEVTHDNHKHITQEQCTNGCVAARLLKSCVAAAPHSHTSQPESRWWQASHPKGCRMQSLHPFSIGLVLTSRSRSDLDSRICRSIWDLCSIMRVLS